MTTKTENDVKLEMASMRPSEVVKTMDIIDNALESYRTTPVIEGLLPGDIVQRRAVPQSLRVLLNAAHVRRALEDYDAYLAMGFNPEGVFIGFSPDGSEHTGTKGDNVFAMLTTDEGYIYRPDAKVGFKSDDFIS